jgi:putative membrane protein
MMDWNALLRGVIASLTFAAVGILVLAIAFGLIRWVTPFSIRKELEEDHNTALAIVIGSVIIGMSLIISAAIHG